MPAKPPPIKILRKPIKPTMEAVKEKVGLKMHSLVEAVEADKLRTDLIVRPLSAMQNAVKALAPEKSKKRPASTPRFQKR